MTTVAEKIEGLERWRERVESATDDYATEEWKERARRTIGQHAAALEGLDPERELPTIFDVYNGKADDLFSAAERAAIIWQFRKHLGLGDFWTAIYKAVDHADGRNLEKLRAAFPELVEGVERWRSEAGFAKRIESLLSR